MADDLIPIFTRPIGDSINAVDARELHSVLEVGRDFSNWIKTRIAELGLVEGTDYEVFANPGENPSGGRPRTEYVLSLDAAKHIALAEKNEKGREVRAYFIRCEKRLRVATPMLDWRSKREERLAAQADTAARKLKIAAFERFLILGGDHVTAPMRQVVGAKIVEIATGEPATMLLPADARADWKTPTEIATDLYTNANVIGRIISDLGLKNSPDSEAITNKAKHHDRQVTSYRYSPMAVERIANAFRERMNGGAA